jgi:MFS family permease
MSFTSAEATPSAAGPVTEPSAGTTGRGWRRNAGLIAVGGGASILGDEAAVVALVLAVSGVAGTATQLSPGAAVAALLIAGMLPAVLLAPVSGWVVDHTRARPLVVIASLAQALACVGLALVHSTAATLGLVLLLGVGATLVQPAWSALVPAVVPEEHVGQALSMTQTGRAVGGLLGPAAGGLLIASGGRPAAMLLDAATFVLLAGAAGMLSADRVPHPEKDAESTRWVSQAVAGFATLLRDRLLRPMLLLLVAFILALGVVNVVEVFFLTGTLGASPAAYGFVGALFAAATIVGAWAARPRADDRVLARQLVVSVVAMTVGVGLVGLSPTVLLAALASMVIGTGNGMLNVVAQHLVIRRVPSQVLGRVFAAIQGTANAAMFGSLILGGVIAGLVDPRSVFLVTAVIGAVAIAVTAAPLLRVRT